MIQLAGDHGNADTTFQTVWDVQDASAYRIAIRENAHFSFVDNTITANGGLAISVSVNVFQRIAILHAARIRHQKGRGQKRRGYSYVVQNICKFCHILVAQPIYYEQTSCNGGCRAG